jgi:RNA polymerase sigma factor (sigma-70 family)
MSTTVRQGPAPELVAAARDGDPRALDTLLSVSMPLVYNLAGRALRGHADVDDVVQETMLRVVRGIGELERPESYRSWLVAITLRQARNQGKARSTAEARTESPDLWHEPADPRSDFAELTILRLGLDEQRRGVAEATRWLDPEDRELLSLWWLEESGHLDRHELARGLGVSSTHAAVRVHRMKRRLDAARRIVEALSNTGRCEQLRSVAEGWDGEPNPLWRKRFDRHVRDCDVCVPRERALIPVARLLRGLPLVPVPEALRMAAAKSAGAGAGSIFGGGSGSGSRGSAGTNPSTSGTGHLKRAASRHARHGIRRATTHSLIASPHVVLATAGVAVAAATAYVLVPASHPATTPSADITRPATVIITPHSATPSPTHPATTAAPSPSRTKAAVVVTPTTQTSSRKGVGAWTFTGDNQALADSGASWFYTWSSTDDGLSAPHAGFVPMIWGSGSVTATALAQAKQVTSCGCVLGFNEPDNSGQANMTAAQALALWPQLEATGLQLGSPAVASGGATPGGWLDQFMSGADKAGYRVNFITLHWYGSDFSTSDAVSQLQSYIEAVYNRYHLPIWLTEFALMGFANGGTQLPTEAEQAAFLTASTAMLDSLPYVQRYAWFGLGATTLPSTGLFQAGPDITPVGTAFEAAR